MLTVLSSRPTDFSLSDDDDHSDANEESTKHRGVLLHHGRKRWNVSNMFHEHDHFMCDGVTV